VPVDVDEAWLGEIRAQVGELPAARRARYIAQYGLNPADAGVITADKRTSDFYEAVIRAGAEPRRASTLIEALRAAGNIEGRAVADVGVTPALVAQIAQLVEQGRIAASKEVAIQVILTARDNAMDDAERVSRGLGILQVSDTAPIDAAIEQLLAQNPKPLQDYRAGKRAAFGALVGIVMKNAKGLNPKIVQERLRERLNA
jgi:aspartyl-tRNA(Asn)/glutamyl-tRNA(Gln) amidotransferase subunit B